MRNLPAIFLRELIRFLRRPEAIKVIQESVRTLKLPWIALLDSETARAGPLRAFEARDLGEQDRKKG